MFQLIYIRTFTYTKMTRALSRNLQECGDFTWGVSDCEELVGESKVSESSPEIFESISDIC